MAPQAYRPRVRISDRLPFACSWVTLDHVNRLVPTTLHHRWLPFPQRRGLYTQGLRLQGEPESIILYLQRAAMS